MVKYAIDTHFIIFAVIMLRGIQTYVCAGLTDEHENLPSTQAITDYFGIGKVEKNKHIKYEKSCLNDCAAS